MPKDFPYGLQALHRLGQNLGANTIAAHWPRIAHMQIADNPGRNEPGTGEINYAWLFNFIDQLGYDGWIGCEYKPVAGTQAGLGWIKTLVR